VNKSVTALLEEILESAHLIRTYTHALSREAFMASTQVQDAVVRRIEIIGEGVKSLPPDWTQTHPEIPWRQIAHMRDTLIHRYFSVDLDIVWQTATVDVPAPAQQLARLLDSPNEPATDESDEHTDA
jgi:uncharacterized protein with HEPN domain